MLKARFSVLFRPKMRQLYGFCRNRCDTRNSCHTDSPEHPSATATCARHAGLSASWKTLGSMEPELSANLRDKRHSDYGWADSAMAVSAEWLGWTGRPSTVFKRWMAWRHSAGTARYRSATGSRIECCRLRSGASSACLPEVWIRPCVVATRLLIQPPADECEAVITRLKYPHHAIRSIIPSVGDEGSPLYSFFGMRRAR